MSALNPLSCIKTSCELVASQSTHVSIDNDALRQCTTVLHSKCLNNNGFNQVQSNGAQMSTGIEWDSNQWHYCADADVRGPLTAQYIFVLDALNFCFWPSEHFEYDVLAVSLKNVLERDLHAFDANRLGDIDEATLNSWFPPEHRIPMASERVDRLRELGTVLKEEYEGLAANMVARANCSVVALVKLILASLPGFRDTAVFKGRLVHFYKRAQIMAADLWAAYGRCSDGSHPYAFRDVHELTMFADYRVPQVLRHLGVLVYSADLSRRVDGMQEIAFGSTEEIEIRANTIVAVQMLHDVLKADLPQVLVLHLDWLLWQWGESVKEHIQPHHRTLTIYY